MHVRASSFTDNIETYKMELGTVRFKIEYQIMISYENKGKVLCEIP